MLALLINVGRPIFVTDDGATMHNRTQMMEFLHSNAKVRFAPFPVIRAGRLLDPKAAVRCARPKITLGSFGNSSASSWC